MSEKAKWLKATRKERGWSAETLAQAIMETAASRGADIALTQQTVSNFENGRVKSVPPWFRWAEAILTGRTDYPDPVVTGSPILTVNLTIPLGSEEALTAMFVGLLAGLDPKAPQVDNARLLARKLPIALSGLRDLRVVSETRRDRPEAPEEDAANLAIANHERQP